MLLQSERVETSNVNGLQTASALFQAQTDQGVLQGKTAFVTYKGHTYQLLSFAPEAVWEKYHSIVVSSLRSFQRLTDEGILRMQPRYLKIITLDRGASLSQLATQASSPLSLEVLAIINQTEVNASFIAGDRVKMVVGE